MEVIGRYVLVENINELKKDIIWEDSKNIRVTAMGTFHDVNQVIYPCVFKYLEPYDSHCCGDYFPCSKYEMVQSVGMEIARLTSKIEKFNKILDTLQDL